MALLRQPSCELHSAARDTADCACTARALPLPAAETYTALFTAFPAVQSNEVYLTPCSTVPALQLGLGVR